MTDFQVGYSTIDITPSVPLPLDGMGNDFGRRDNWIEPVAAEDRLRAYLILIRSGGESCLLCAMDTLFVHELFSDPASEAVAKAIGIKAGNVFFSGSHTHSGVSMDEIDEDVLRYNRELCDKMAEAAKVALADLKPAAMQIGSVETVGMNAPRRYLLKDGSHRSTVHDKSFTHEQIAGYDTTPDRTLRVVKFLRDGGKDIMLVNWQMHPSFTAKVQEGRASADVMGSICTQWQEEVADSYLVFFQGTCGNMARVSRWESDPGYQKMKSFDRAGYAKEFVRIIREDVPMRHADTGAVKVEHRTLTVHQKKGRTVLEQTHTLHLNAISFGDMAVCTVPGEPFSNSGLRIREESPFAMTFVLGNCNGCYGYLPVQSCYDGETCGTVHELGDSFEVRVSKCEPGTAEKIVDTLIQALHTL